MNPAQTTIVSSSAGAVHNVLGAPYRFLVTSAETGGAFALLESIAPPQSIVPLHLHTREDETFFMLEGTLEIQCGDSTVPVSKNSTAFLPRNVPHAYRNTSNLSAKYLIFITPGGFEKCLQEFAQLPAAQPPTLETLAAIGNKYGLQFVPPNA
jgi:mannose-6-phosphate isomerase-like protein (cupin superfamily)